MDPLSSSPKFPINLLILFAIFILCSFPTTVRSEHSSDSTNFIRLPSDSHSHSQSQSADRCSTLSSPKSPSVCPVNCFRPDPVCGVDGVTYWCGCQEAQCAGVKVAKKGFCEVGIGVSAPLSAQALLLVHLVWLIVLGFAVFFGLF